MFIEIENLKDEPLHVSHKFPAGEVSLAHEDANLDDAVRVEFTLTHRERELHFGGSLSTRIRFTCARCLQEVSRPLTASYDLLYLPHPASRGPDEEIELKYEEMEIGFYDGIRFDVGLMVLEQIELALPMRFLCREGCKGLCPACGQDLNRGTCGCPAEAPDSRMAALFEFRKKMDKS